MARRQPPLLHAGRRESGKSDHVSHGIDVRHNRLIVFVDREPVAVVAGQTGFLKIEILADTLPTDGIHQRVSVQFLARLQRGTNRCRTAVSNSLFNLRHFFSQPHRDTITPIGGLKVIDDLAIHKAQEFCAAFN
jgi:hypothetical protein